jgi:hypothetical protein
MSYSIASPFVRRAAPRRPSRRSRSLGSWLLVLVEGMAEAFTARAHYHRLADRGLRPEMALRIAFDLLGAKEHQPRSRAASTETEQDQ